MKTFTYNGELYIRVIPAKTLCRSSLIYEVITRGDIFAIRAKDSVLTIIPGTSQVEHHIHELSIKHTKQTRTADSEIKRSRRKAADFAKSNREKQRPLFGNL